MEAAISRTIRKVSRCHFVVLFHFVLHVDGHCRRSSRRQQTAECMNLQHLADRL